MTAEGTGQRCWGVTAPRGLQQASTSSASRVEAGCTADAGCSATRGPTFFCASCSCMPCTVQRHIGFRNKHTPGSRSQAGVAIQRCWMVMLAKLCSSRAHYRGCCWHQGTALEQMVLIVFGVCTGRSHPRAGSDLWAHCYSLGSIVWTECLGGQVTASRPELGRLERQSADGGV